LRAIVRSVLCGDSSCSQHVMIFSSGTTASRYGGRVTVRRLVTFDRIGYIVGRYFAACSRGVYIPRRWRRVFQAARLKGRLASIFLYLLARKRSVVKRDARPLFLTCWRCFNDLLLWTMLGVSSIRTGHSLASVLERRMSRSIVVSKALYKIRAGFSSIFQNELPLRAK